ncbi:MAG: aminotransferase class IV [Nitrospinaceae bacterium]
MTTKINFNGQIGDDARISVFDHGFLFGDSVYEVVTTHKGRPCFLEPHLIRLRQSARSLALEIPWSDEALTSEIERTLESAGNEESYIRLIVTRGEGEIDLDPTTCTQPQYLILVTPLKLYPSSYYEKGINVALVSIKRNQKEALNPGIKTGNYLNNVLAKMEANRSGADDALMLNHQGFLTECTTSNFFFFREGRVLTPSLKCGILAGITRDLILQLAHENGILVEQGEWPPEFLEQADEAFLTGTVKGVMPVTQLDGRVVGEGVPGPVTRRLMKLYDQFLEKMP